MDTKVKVERQDARDKKIDDLGFGINELIRVSNSLCRIALFVFCKINRLIGNK